MGLHPQAIAVIMLLVFDLLWRGYRVVLSTHSPLVLDIVWAIHGMREHDAKWQLLAGAFGLQPEQAVQKVMEHALNANETRCRVYFLDIDPKSHRATTRDISNLDPDSDNDQEATWGGLTGFSTNFGDAVRAAVNEGTH